MKQADVLKRIKGLKKHQRRATICALVGHSDIVSLCFGYIHCGRCEAQIGDCLGGADNTVNNVIVGHNCDKCLALYEKLDWKHKLETPDPFVKENSKIY